VEEIQESSEDEPDDEAGTKGSQSPNDSNREDLFKSDTTTAGNIQSDASKSTANFPQTQGSSKKRDVPDDLSSENPEVKRRMLELLEEHKDDPTQ
jgi:hypothetical protein